MPTEIQAKLQKIRRASIIFRVICTGLLALITFLGLSCVVCAVFGIGGINYDSVIFTTAGLKLGHRIILGVVTALTFGILFKCFYHLHRLLGNLLQRRGFHPGVCQPTPSVWHCLLLWSVMNFFWGASLALSAHPAESFQGHADSLVIGAVIILIAWFMDMAVELARRERTHYLSGRQEEEQPCRLS